MKEIDKPIHKYRKNFDSCGGPLAKNKRKLPSITHKDQLLCLRQLLIRLLQTDSLGHSRDFFVDNDDTIAELVGTEFESQFRGNSSEIVEYLELLQWLKPMLMLYGGEKGEKLKNPSDMLLFRMVLDRLSYVKSSLISALHKIAVLEIIPSRIW